MYANPVYIELSNTCKWFGYKIDRAYLTSWGEPRIGIFPDSGRYLPQLYLRTEVDYVLKKTAIIGWEIQTTSYGSLLPKEFERMLTAYEEAFRLVRVLERINLSELEVLPDKFDDDEA